MRAVLGLALGFLLIGAGIAPACANDLRGVYVSRWPTELAQMRVFGSGGVLKGELDSMEADPTQPGGVRRIVISLKLFQRDSHVVILLRRPFLSTEQRWTADAQKNGDFIVTIPETSGESGQTTFYLVPPARAHRIASELLATAAREKRELDDADHRQRALLHDAKRRGAKPRG